jgi:hypothetical protein
MEAICPKCGRCVDVKARSGRGECSICGHLGAMIDFTPAGDSDLSRMSVCPAGQADAVVYKIVEQRAGSIDRSTMTAGNLEDIINTHARKGWVLDRLVDVEQTRSLGIGSNDTFLIIFRQDPHRH